MITITRTNAANPDFISLVKLLDEDLAIRDGDEHAFYDQYNKLENINHVVLAYNNNEAVSCGAFKELEPGIIEIKRMFTAVQARGKGIASKVLKELEIWATELSYTAAILETGKKQPEAIALYKKNGYYIIPNYGPYAGMENSVCFKKKLRV